MEKTIIITGLVVILTICIVLRIVVSYLRLIIRKLDRVRGCTQTETETESKWRASITQTYIDNLNKQIRTLTQEVTQLSIDNVVKEGEIRQLKKELEMANKEKSGE